MQHDRYAVVFPGQGSQAVGMLKEFIASYPTAKKVFDEASEVLSYDLWGLVQNGPEEVLNQTEFTQPALLVAGVAVWRVWKEQTGSTPIFLAGHSLGEYTALVCAQAMNFLDAVKIVRSRGIFMQAACKERGGMVAVVGLDDSSVQQVCTEAAQEDILVVANYNSIGQTVLAGHFAAAERAAMVAKRLGAKIAKILPVSVPSHCMLMKPAAEQLSVMLDGVNISAPNIPVIHNVDVVSYNQPQKIREALVRQLYSPVRWVETVQHIVNAGVGCILECGPGKVLTGLNRRISGDIVMDYLGDSQKIAEYL